MYNLLRTELYRRASKYSLFDQDLSHTVVNQGNRKKENSEADNYFLASEFVESTVQLYLCGILLSSFCFVIELILYFKIFNGKKQKNNYYYR